MREAGVLLHISSLPSKYGIGTLGKAAYDFIDFLHASGQSIWQILPIGPTSYGDSPYQSPSSFACNPYFIDFELLVKDGLLKEDDLPQDYPSPRVDYGRLFNERYATLHKAYLNKDKLAKEFDKFKDEEAYWLTGYAEYSVLKTEHENKPWNQWYDDFKYKVGHAMDWFRNQYKEQIDEVKFYQFLFMRQWNALHKYAKKNGVKIMGDIPIYCAYDSADVWTDPSNFQLDYELKPTFVAGCPPDAFSADGQLWGNPLYNYNKMKEENYLWWVKRVKHSLKLFDMLRIDHFRGFAGYYAIPYGAINAKSGHWEVGPGYDLFEAIEHECKGANIVAENLGFLTDDVFELLDKCGYPGMHILQFEFGDGVKVPFKKKFEENSIVYTGTHDNQTVASYYNQLDEKFKAVVSKTIKCKFADRPELKAIEACMKQASNYCIIPLQDYLGLGDDEGRMNIPSTSMGNWTYRCRAMDFTPELSDYILNITKKTDRYTE